MGIFVENVTSTSWVDIILSSINCVKQGHLEGRQLQLELSQTSNGTCLHEASQRTEAQKLSWHVECPI